MKKIILIATALIFVATVVKAQQVVCRVEGVVKDRPESRTLKLVNMEQDPRFYGVEIPIVDGRFEYTLNTDIPRIWQLIFMDELNQGAWMPTRFCASNDTVRFVLNPEEQSELNTVNGGEENAKIARVNAYMKNLDSLYIMPHRTKLNAMERSEMLTPRALELWYAIKQSTEQSTKDSLLKICFKMEQDKEQYTDEAKALLREHEQANVRVGSMIKTFYMQEPSLYAFSNLISELEGFDSQRMQCQTIDQLEKQMVEVYQTAYPNHPYVKIAQELIKAIKAVRVGGRYVDFSAPDLDGKMHKLSDLIDGKIAVIDLWASWCGPCRRSSISLIPLWDEYAGEDFTIVGVARESNNDAAMRKALEKDGYKWVNLIELDEREGIWQKYGASNAAGKVLLVDRDGTILALEPDATKIRAVLKEKLGR